MITGPQIKAARALLGVDQKTLAQLADLSVPTIQRMEASEGTVGGTVESMVRVIGALEKAGVDLINDGKASTEGGRGVRLLTPSTGASGSRPPATDGGAE